MRRATPITPAAVIMTVFMTPLLIGTGCVQQNKYDDTVLASHSLKEQLVASERNSSTAVANLEEVRGQLTEAKATNAMLREQVDAINADFTDQADKYDELLRRVSLIEFGPLPVELEMALDHLASAYPHLLSFDADHGLLRFYSDFSFDLGSAELKADAPPRWAPAGQG